jgi:hypothetical protein
MLRSTILSLAKYMLACSVIMLCFQGVRLGFNHTATCLWAARYAARQ